MADLRAALGAGHRAVIAQAPTGAGKGSVIAYLGALAASKGRSVVVVSHLGEINRDLRSRLEAGGAGHVRFSMGTAEEGPADALVTVTSVQTAAAREAAFPNARLFLLDEVHRGASPSYQSLIERHPSATFIGFTATPARADGRPLAHFTAIVAGPQVRELLAVGLLAPITVLAPATRTHELSQDPVAVYPVGSDGRARPGVVFASSVEHSEAIAASLCADRGMRAQHVDGTTPAAERADAIARFNAGDLDVLTCRRLIVEGVDVPRAEVCMLAGAVSSPVAFLQAVGRVRRPGPGKEALLLDLCGSFHSHGHPDEDRTYHLDGDAIRVARSALDQPTQCRGCLAWGMPRSICAACGFERPGPPPPKVKAKDLIEFRSQQGDAAKFGALRRYVESAVGKGRKPASAIYVYRGVYGAFPPRGWLDAVIAGREPNDISDGGQAA